MLIAYMYKFHTLELSEINRINGKMKVIIQKRRKLPKSAKFYKLNNHKQILLKSSILK